MDSFGNKLYIPNRIESDYLTEPEKLTATHSNVLVVWIESRCPQSKDSSGIVLQDASSNLWDRPRAYSNRYESWDNNHLQVSFWPLFTFSEAKCSSSTQFIMSCPFSHRQHFILIYRKSHISYRFHYVLFHSNLNVFDSL